MTTAQATIRPLPARRQPSETTIPPTLETAIGREVRERRQKLGMTVAELAKAAGMSAGMLSKIENGVTSPSLGTLQSLAQALNLPVAGLFRRYDEQRQATYTPAGEGMRIERRGTRCGHLYELLGRAQGNEVTLEPYMITLDEASEAHTLFQHDGIEFIHVLAGEMRYRHGEMTYHLKPGDSLQFEADAPHGPEELLALPVRFLAVIASQEQEGTPA